MEKLPTYERQEKLQGQSPVDYQSAYLEAAKQPTLMGQIGSQVAQSASQAMAQTLGVEAGKTPTGGAHLTLTDFDKTFNETYNAQAGATLSIKGQKLLDEVHLNISQAPRLTPELLNKAETQLSQGLANISKDAPTGVRTSLEKSFSAQMLNNMTQYREKMFADDRRSQKDNLSAAIDFNNNSMYEVTKSGNFTSGKDMLDNIIEMVDNGVNVDHFSKVEAIKLKDAAKLNYLKAQYLHVFEINEKAGKTPEFLRNYVENKPSGMTDEQWVETGKSIYQEMNFIQTMKAQDEDLKSQQMLNKIAVSPNLVTQTDWNNFAAEVSPLRAEKVRFHLLQAMNKSQTTSAAVDNLIKNYDSAEAQAIAKPEVKDAAFLKKVNATIENSKKVTVPYAAPTPISSDEAQVQVATSSGNEVPVFTRILKNKLKSPNPTNIISGLNQIHSLYERGAGQVLSGLNEQDQSMISAAESLVGSPDPIKEAQEAHNRIYNQNPDIQKLNDHNFQNILTKKNRSGIGNEVFALNQVGLDKSDFLNPSIATAYGINILNKLSNFYSISGNLDEATKSTKRWVDENYGDTFVNGGKHKMLHPPEKEVGFSGRDGVPYIQQNVIDQFNQKLLPIKTQYEKKEINEYWEMLPVDIQTQKPVDILKNRVLNPYLPEIKANKDEKLGFKAEDILFRASTGQYIEKEYTPPTDQPSRQHGIFFNTYDPIKIKRHIRTAQGEKTDLFNVILVGNAYGKYDVSIETSQGMRNLYQEAPHLQISEYVLDEQNKQKIRDAYNKDHS